MTPPRLLSGTMLAIACGAILVPLNSTMLAVALPSVMTEFGVGAGTVSWLVTLYLGAVAVALPASGSLGDRFGHRRAFLTGVILFALASLLAAVADSFDLLALSRVVQAVSGALVSTSSVALVRALAPAERRGAAYGLFDMLVSTSAAVGPLVGGLLVAGFGWRALFFVALPVALVAAATVGLVPRLRDRPRGSSAPDEPAPAPRPIDVPGLALLALFLIALLVALRGFEDGGPTLLAAFAAPVLLALFVRFELRAEHPAVDPRLFRHRPFAAAVAGVLGATVILHASFILVPMLVERVQAGSPTTSGIALLGIFALGAIGAPLGGRASDRLGRRTPAVAGALLCSAGLLVLWLVAAETTAFVLALLLGIVGLGLGLTGSPRQAAAMESVGSRSAGMAAGTYFTGRYMGGVLGASLAGVVLGGTVTAGGVSLGFGVLALVGVAVVITCLGLPGRARGRPAGDEGAEPTDLLI